MKEIKLKEISIYFQKDGRPKDGYDLVGRFNMEVDKPHAIFWLEELISLMPFFGLRKS